MPSSGLMISGIPMVVVKPIDASEFDSIATLKKLIKDQDLPIGIVNQKSWDKYESLLFDLEELKKMETK